MMTGAPAVGQSRTSGAAAMLPVPDPGEPFLAARRRPTTTLDVHGVCEAVPGGLATVFGASARGVMSRRATIGRFGPCGVVAAAPTWTKRRDSRARGGAGEVCGERPIQVVADAARDDRWSDPERVGRPAWIACSCCR